jgi:hypothetical protein
MRVMSVVLALYRSQLASIADWGMLRAHRRPWAVFASGVFQSHLGNDLLARSLTRCMAATAQNQTIH